MQTRIDPPGPVPSLETLRGMAARFAPVDLGADISSLPPAERAALAALLRAARVCDVLFLRQVSPANEAWLLDLVADESPLGRARLDNFLLNRGPWSRLDGQAPFLPGVGAKPPQANFYPAGATRDGVEAWLASLPPDAYREATGFFTTIRRRPDGVLVSVPYALDYQGELGEAASWLRRAAARTGDATLRRFLELRADAFTSNDYYDSDVAWMELESAIEPTIGPDEVYEDEWFNYKAAFEAFVTVRDDVETARLQRIGAELQSIEDHLPIDARFRNPRLGSMAPIRVVNTIFSAGDGNRGVQTAAFNLPNDERIITLKGAKRVMLKNNQEAKFRMVLEPIARAALAPSDLRFVTFEAFFAHILLHELMHGLGPHAVEVAGRSTTVRQELKETYSTIEEMKADVSGLFALQFLIDRGRFDASLQETMYVTYLASMFRSLRFGLDEAHGQGVAIQLNSFLDGGGVRVAPDGTFGVDPRRIRENVTALTGQVMTIQATGAYDEARGLIARLGVLRPEVAAVLARVSHVPVDIRPRFVTASELLAG